LNLPFTSRQHDELFPSYNDSVDTERAYANYCPHDPLPTLVTVSNEAGRRNITFRNITLASLDGFIVEMASTVEMASAFQQYAANVSYSQRLVTLVTG
jgi:hypothetical protein